MAKYIGRRLSVGIGRETSRGAGKAADVWLPHVAVSFDDKAEKARSESGVGKIIDQEDSLVSNVWAEGDIEAEVRDQSIGHILYALLGSLSTSGPSDSAYTHSFSINDTNAAQSLALTMVDANTTEMYRLAMVNSFEMNLELDQTARFSAGFMSKRGVGSSATASFSAENKFTKSHLTFKVASAIGGLAGASAISLKSLNLSISKNTVLDTVLGTAEPEDVLNQQLMIEGSVTLNYEDETWKNYMMNNTKRAMQIKLANTDATIGASTNPSLDFQFPNVEFYDWEPNYALDEIVTQTLSFKAMEDLTNSQAAITTCDLVNEKSSY